MVRYRILDCQDLYLLALVNRPFSALAVVSLYNTVELLSWSWMKGPRLSLLIRTCRESSARTLLIHSLTLSWIHEDDERRCQIMDLLAEASMLRGLSLTIRRDQELEEALDPPALDCPNPTHFFDRCQMVFLRSSRVHCPRITIAEVIKYTLLPSLESLKIGFLDILQTSEILLDIPDSSEVTASGLKHLEFRYSKMPTRPALEALVGNLNSLESLDWEIYNIIDVTWWNSALSFHLLPLSQTLVNA
jgi:hypothetical protein